MLQCSFSKKKNVSGRYKILSAFLLSCSCIGLANGEDNVRENIAKHSLKVELTNDILLKSDGNYTNGAAINWLATYSGNTYDKISHQNPIWQMQYDFNAWLSAKNTSVRIVQGINFNQHMWTPEEISLTTPQPNDRPYAGLLTAESYSGFISSTSAVKSWLTIGTMGPNSFAEKMQNWVHDLTGSDQPNGWQYQVENSPIGQISFEIEKLMMRSLFTLGSGMSHELSAFAYTSLGNFRNEVMTGLQYRVGPALAKTFADNSFHHNQINSVLGTSRNFELTGYTKLAVGMRFNDLSLQGSLPYDSLATIERQQLKWQSGLHFSNNEFDIALTAVVYSKDHQQAAKDFYSYTGLSLSYHY